jgi:hypothetical protein
VKASVLLGPKNARFFGSGDSLFHCHNSFADTTVMENYLIKNCKECHKPLRIPADIGGMLMRCPCCGHEFHTDFKLAQKVMDGGEGKEPVQKTLVQRPPSRFKLIV